MSTYMRISFMEASVRDALTSITCVWFINDVLGELNTFVIL